MPKLEFDFSPYGIVALCPDLPQCLRFALLNQLDLAWDDTWPFEVEVEVPMWEEPYFYFLRIGVSPSDEQVTIERRTSNASNC